MREVDARGLSCPEPLMLTAEAIKSDDSPVKVLVTEQMCIRDSFEAVGMETKVSVVGCVKERQEQLIQLKKGKVEML